MDIENKNLEDVTGGRVINTYEDDAIDTYIVRPGDSLNDIAIRLQYDGGWLAIYNLNANQIANANLIHPGQKLKVRRRCIHNPDYLSVG